MPLTRYERGIIEDLMNKNVKLQARLAFVEAEVKRLNEAIITLGGNKVLSNEELAEELEDAVRKIIKKLNVKLHTHLSDQEGGDAFAKKGANLIE